MLIKNIKELIQVEQTHQLLVAGKAMSQLQTIKDAYLLIEGDLITGFGKNGRSGLRAFY